VSLRGFCYGHPGYTKGCPGCREHARKYRAARRRGVASGTWESQVVGVELDRVREHVRGLVDAGFSVLRIAEALQIRHMGVYRLLNGKTSRLRPDLAAGFLSLTAGGRGLGPPPPGQLVPSVGVARRLRALLADGWSTERLEEISGIGRSDLVCWRRGYRPTIKYSTWLKVSDLYDKIQGLPDPLGDSTPAMWQARRLGYAGADRWVGVDIDDPAAAPLGAVRDLDDPVWVERAVAAVWASDDPGAGRDLPRELKRQVGYRARREGRSLSEIGRLLGLSTPSTEYLLDGRKDRPETWRGKRVA
jgi:hypothetical protein